MNRYRSFSRALAALVVIGATPAPAQVGGPNGPQIAISHRGASAYAPEHTFFAYDMAMAMDVDMIECDLILTKDEVPVCIHDETVDRTSESTGRVDSYTLAQMREMDFGSWFNTSNPTLAKPEYAGAKIVPLEEQLDCYLRHNPLMRFHIETKDSAGGRAEQVMVDLLTRKGLIATGDVANGNVPSSTIVLQSFDAGSLERMRQLAPSIPTAFLYTAPTGDAAQWHAAGTGPDYIDAFAPNSAAILADPSVLQRYHTAGHDVHTWTVNDAQQMGALLDLGVDGIFSNNPDLLRAAIDERGTGTTPEQRGNPAEFERGCPGIAGRVTSNQGPGDVWRPTGTRGVELAGGASETPVVFGESSGVVLGGSFGVAVLGVLLLGFALRR
ncbi:MAG TPA: glycerophosphodiester phosphodiesterase family protein [Verrucomicrobiae bacterium]|nr:glycerophosphodiester phosphodiesterase family protein [Verrucomicrobiae bacterium]